MQTFFLGCRLLGLALMLWMGAATWGHAQAGRVPDLVVTDIVLTPENPRPGEAVTVQAVIQNQGRADFTNAFNGARVINLSLGAPEDLCGKLFQDFCENKIQQELEAQEAAINLAVGMGVVVIASAGNEAAGVGYPARFDGAIAVGATTMDDGLAEYSNVGPQVSVSAPGGELSEQQLKDLFILSASDFEAVVPQLATLVITPYPGAGYGWFSGTSSAAPFVSGVAALILSANPDLAPQQVRQLLEQTATDLGAQGKDEAFGAGLVNAKRAVEAALAIH